MEESNPLPGVVQAGLMAKVQELEMQNRALTDRCATLRLQIMIMSGQVEMPTPSEDPEPDPKS